MNARLIEDMKREAVSHSTRASMYAGCGEHNMATLMQRAGHRLYEAACLAELALLAEQATKGSADDSD